MLRRSLGASVLAIASVHVEGNNSSQNSLPVDLECDASDALMWRLNSTDASRECCRWLRAWYRWQECDQKGQDCATEEAINSIEKKLCSDKCVGFLDKLPQHVEADPLAEHESQAFVGSRFNSELRPYCAVSAQSQQCPPLQLGDLDVDDFPWIGVILGVAIVACWVVFVFHRRCLPKKRHTKSEHASVLNPRQKPLECEAVGSSLRCTAAAALDNAAISGSFGAPSQEIIHRTPDGTYLETRSPVDAFGVEPQSKESGLVAPRSLSLPPAPRTLSPLAQDRDSKPLAPTAAPIATPSPSSLPPPPPNPPTPSSILKPTAPPPVWHAPSPANHVGAAANTQSDLTQYIPQSPKGFEKWPPCLGFLWALRRAFVRSAFIGGLLRAALLILRVCIPSMEAIPVAVEMTFLTLQLLWVKGPPPGETGTELPIEVTHGGPGCKLPRFGVFAATTAILELFSVAVTSQVSLSQACDFLPVVLIILEAPATVARCYSAFLAWRLQDEADKLVKMIVPINANLGDICIGHPESPANANKMSPGKLIEEKDSEASQDSLKPRKSSLFNCSSCHRSTNEPKLTERPRTRALVVIVGSVIAVLCSVALALVLTLHKPEDEVNNELPSSCVTRRSSITTCELYEQLGSAIGGVDPLEECCRGCDELEGCQAWIFDGATLRCRWIAFTEEPCATTPDKTSCHCQTHSHVVFGYRPTTKT